MNTSNRTEKPPAAGDLGDAVYLDASMDKAFTAHRTRDQH